MITIAPLSLEYLADWSALLAESFGKTAAQMEQQLYWLHRTPLPDHPISSPVVAYGAWEGGQLVGQYSCLLRTLHLPNAAEPMTVGMSLNMAVHPEFRGRGMIKKMAAPVYDALQALDAAAGVGFSNASGVKVDRHSKGYGYSVVGQMIPTVYWLPPTRPRNQSSLELTRQPPGTLSDSIFEMRESGIRFAQNTDWFCHRFDAHPSRYCYGVQKSTCDGVTGVSVYREIKIAGIPGVALLAAYTQSGNLPALLREWSAQVRRNGGQFIHVLPSAGSSLHTALRGIGVGMRVPFSRSPYYLTVKPLTPSANALLDFTQWDCTGGDIL